MNFDELLAVLSIAPKTLANFLERITQLYEQGADVRRIGKYVRNWWRWVSAGVEISVVTVFTVLKVLMFSLPTSEDPSNRPYPIFDHRISRTTDLLPFPGWLYPRHEADV